MTVRVLFASAMAVTPAPAQNALVRLLNLSRPADKVFHVGDRFEVLITGVPNQPISVRTTMEARTDWGPIIGSTDSTGSWSATGQFDKSDFGGWEEVWTVGGKLATPAVQFSVNAPCLPGGKGFAASTRRYMMLTCETPDGSQSFSTPSDSAPFRTPDGRLAPGRSMNETQDPYQMGILQGMITDRRQLTGPISFSTSRGARGDETADLIMSLIGANALGEGEMRNVLVIIRSAFDRPETIAPGAKYPVRSLKLLQHLMDFTDQSGLRREIAATMVYVQSR